MVKNPDMQGRSKQLLRLWLKMLGCESRIENNLRSRLRDSFGVTLPQFDVLAKLDYMQQPLTMTELSNQLMVSNGNVTGVVDRLVREGYVQRTSSPDDRRVQLIQLTDAGRDLFSEMAIQHESWIEELFEQLGPEETSKLSDLLGKLLENIKQKQQEIIK